MPRKTVRIRRGRGTSVSGSGLKRTGMGRRCGGSMRSYRSKVPVAVRKKEIAQLNKIVRSAKKPGKSRSGVIKKLRGWATKAHSTAKKYNLYSGTARLGYAAYQAKYGSKLKSAPKIRMPKPVFNPSDFVNVD